MAYLTRAVSSLTIKPTMTLRNDATSGATVGPIALNPADKTYTPTSSPPGSEYAADDVTLVGSSWTIDLTDLTDIEGIAVDGSGLKVQEIRVQADSDNTAAITVAGGDADPYELFGAGGSVPVPPGGVIVMRFEDALDDILTGTGAGESDIKFSGTIGDKFSYEIIMG